MNKTALNFNRSKYGLPLYPVSRIKPADRKLIDHAWGLMRALERKEKELLA